MEKNRIRPKKTFLGLMWIVLSTGIGKLSSLIAQIILGWVLSKNDFGLYALAFSISSSVALLRNGGAQQILIQRGSEYEELAPIIMRFSFLFNILACALLLIAAPFAANLYQQEELTLMISIIGLLIPVSTVNNIFRSRLLIKQDFKSVSIIDMSSGILRQGSTITFAMLGFGYMSFIWPILIEVLFTILISYYFVKEFPKKARLRWLDFKIIFKDSKWIMLGSLAIALGYSGQYFVIGLFENTANLGIYFFGFQLVGSIAVIFTYAIETVFFPMLSSIKGNKDSIKKSYTKTIYTIILSATPLCIIISIFTEEIIDLIWGAKWTEAINIIEPMILTVPALMAIAINRSILEANGLWGQRLLALGLYVLGDMLVAGFVAWFGDIYQIAIATSTFRILSTLVQCGHVAIQTNIKIRRIVNVILPSVLFSIMSYLLAIALVKDLDFGDYDFNKNPYIISFIFLSVYFLMQMLFERKSIYRHLIE